MVALKARGKVIEDPEWEENILAATENEGQEPSLDGYGPMAIYGHLAIRPHAKNNGQLGYPWKEQRAVEM